MMNPDESDFSTNSTRASPYGSFPQRLGALLVDSVLAIGCGMAVVFVSLMAIGPIVFFVPLPEPPDIEAAESALFAVMSSEWGLGVVCYFWLGNSLGGTPGKRILGLRVLSASDQSNLGLRRGLIRYLVFLVGGFLFYLGWLWVIWDNKNQAWHDKAADSLVVRKTN